MFATDTSISTKDELKKLLFQNPNVYFQQSTDELIKQTIALGQGVFNNTGALVIKTGTFTGRSPKDKFIVRDKLTEHTVNWNDFNIAFDEQNFEILFQDMLEFVANKKIWVRDCLACADEKHQLKIKVITEKPWSNLFAKNMFIEPNDNQLRNFSADWQILCVPSFEANPEIHGTRAKNFAVVNFTQQIILIGGTGYTGEIKKGIFSVLNFLLPHNKNVLSMHCSANEGKDGDVAIFFGLSGTGKTTLSADAKRKLIGDDEHGWDDKGIFNFEGGCYAKCIDLSEEKEPEIFNAVKRGALVENTTFIGGSNVIDFASKQITENTRVSYPISFISNAKIPSIGGLPKNIFFLTCDAYGILPPISKLSKEQAMYQFMTGYTAKIAGTEAGVTEPKGTFSACFGAPFLPLHPNKYAKLLGEKLEKYNTNVWLINTGWSGGQYGEGKRISLKYTRAIINAVLNNELENVSFENFERFNFKVPTTVPNVPSEILQPRNTWADKNKYDEIANKLATAFVNNFKKFESETDKEILDAAPKVI